MTARIGSLLAKLHSKGYCCLRGYLETSRDNEIPAKEMAADMAVSPHTIWYHYRQNTKGKIPCQEKCACMLLNEQPEKNPPKRG